MLTKVCSMRWILTMNIINKVVLHWSFVQQIVQYRVGGNGSWRLLICCALALYIFWTFFSICYNIFDGAPLLHTINQPIKFNNFHFDVQYLSKYFEKYCNEAYFFSECERMKSFQKLLRCCLALIKTQINLVSMYFDLFFWSEPFKNIEVLHQKNTSCFCLCWKKFNIFFIHMFIAAGVVKKVSILLIKILNNIEQIFNILDRTRVFGSTFGVQ